MISIRDSATLGLVYSAAGQQPSINVAQNGGRGAAAVARRRGERESVSWPHILLLHAFNRSEDDKALVILSTALLGRLAVHITLQSWANDPSGCRLIVAAAAATEE